MISSYAFAILAAFFWGAGFIGSRFGLEELTPMWVTFFRFLIAFIVGLPLLRKVLRKDLSLNMILGALISATFLYAMMFLQTEGLQHTSVAKSGFITILYAFFTPIICFVFYKQKLSYYYWCLLALAFVGMAFMCELSLDNLNRGDLLTLLCALITSFHILAISHFSKKIDNFAFFNLLQMFFVCVISLPMACYFDGVDRVLEGSFISNTNCFLGLLFMGVFSTMLGFGLQVKSQQKIPPQMASLIFLLESPFAAVLGLLVFAESLSSMMIGGSSLVMLSVGLMMFDGQQKELFFIARKKLTLIAPKFANFLSLTAVLLLV